MPGPQQALSAAYDSWNAGDLDGYLRVYDEGIGLHGYFPGPMDKTQVRGFYESIFSAFGTRDCPSTRSCGTATCAIRFTMGGRHVQEFMGVPATGTTITLPGITILHFRGDRVTERFLQAGMLGLLVQLAAMPAPA